jgi:hypothetical protein
VLTANVPASRSLMRTPLAGTVTVSELTPDTGSVHVTRCGVPSMPFFAPILNVTGKLLPLA